MKKVVIIAALAVGIIAGLVFVKSGPKALNINEVGADPAAYTGTITVTGIMGGRSQQNPDIIGIMDIKELQCKTANCNKVFLPVKFSGKAPVIGDEVRITGSFVDMGQGQGYLFMAQSLKVVRHHKIGG
ncbi:hypothetical protein [Geobacter sp. DSM 9736]|uniref:hypothetical protein n=1 Tax=Geobacter sp. DSM 9736 TaxID=1277350 RepID=UPI000B50BD23|nr:hypothetical protein [Geobacter sp. DSM 9736]SNB46243.1 hypothetical protein SAMN06269301_1688 [Geobacter sp. DSM 9736]